VPLALYDAYCGPIAYCWLSFMPPQLLVWSDEVWDARMGELNTVAAALGVASLNRFTGFQSDMKNVLAELDILVHSSTLPEPFGRVVLEGMASGLAVIACDEGGPREMIRHGADGLLVPPSDPRALARALDDLIRQPWRIRELGQSPRRRVEEKCGIDRMARELAALYSRFLCPRADKMRSHS